MSTADFMALALRIGLEGDELRAWVEEREARAREDRAAELEARKEEEELKRQQKELEIAKQKTLQLQLKLAEVEKLRFVRENRHAVSSMSGSEQAAEGCDVGNSFLWEKSDSLVEGGGGLHHEHSRKQGAQPENNSEVRGASRKSSGELDEADESFGGVEQKRSIWDGLYFGASGGPSTAMKEARVPQNCSDERASVGSVSDNVEDPLENSTQIVTNYLCGPLDAAAWDMDSVYEDKLESHKDVTTSNCREDCDALCGIDADSQDSERHSEEFTDAIGCLKSKGDEPPMEKGFGSYESIGEVHEEVTVPLDDDGRCRAASEREVGTIECVSPVGDTCGAGMVECHADDLVVREGSSQDDANGVCLSQEENSARVLLLEFAMEQNEVMVPYAGVPEVDGGVQAQGFLRSIAGVNVSSVTSPDARTNSARTMQSIDMTEDGVPTLHGGCTSQLYFECSDCCVCLFTSARRPSHFRRIYTWKSSLRRCQVFREVFSAEHVKIACRMVWDAIT